MPSARGRASEREDDGCLSPGALRIERRVERHRRVIATLDRPATRNAIDQELVDALHALCAELETDPRVLVITGAGGVFASGADISQLRDRRADDARRGINTMAFRRIRNLPMPVIAAIDGWALGGGAELAYAADIRIATPAAKLGNPETGLGIIAAAGATWRLPEIIGHARASELLLTGRILTADEALEWGLVSSLHEPDELLPAALRHRGPHRGERSPRDPSHQDRAARRPPTRTRRSSSSCRPSCSRARRRCGA